MAWTAKSLPARPPVPVLAGVLLAVAYLRTRSLWFATAVHLSLDVVTGTYEVRVQPFTVTVTAYCPLIVCSASAITVSFSVKLTGPLQL